MGTVHSTKGRYVIELHSFQGTRILQHFEGERWRARHHVKHYRKAHAGEGAVRERWIGPMSESLVASS